MQFNREMINTVRRIAKLAPDLGGSQHKLSNPDLVKNLRTLHGISENEELRKQIEHFFALADQKLIPGQKKNVTSKKMYRGSALVSDEKRAESTPSEIPAKKKKLTYRGREFEA